MKKRVSKDTQGLEEAQPTFVRGYLETVQRVVGIGTSAGGLETLGRLFSKMEKMDDVSFIVAQHQSPNHESQLGRIIASKCPYPIETVEHDQTLKMGMVYVLPPGAVATIDNGKFQLQSILNRQASVFSIDQLLFSLADSYSNRAVAIILSGAGSDGAKGAAAIHRAGGTVIVQDARSATFDGMPLSAIAMGCYDATMRVDDMADALLRLQATNSIVSSISIEDTAGIQAGPFERLIAALKTVDEVNFGQYKPGTIIRRIERRMSVCRYRSLSAYTDHVENCADELHKLHADLLIGVTRFFRDPISFASLERRFLPHIAEKMAKGVPIRIWIPGCSTGEEVFSLAMIIFEQMESFEPQPEVKVFATDIDASALAVASVGSYHEDFVLELGEERIKRHFVKDGNQYRVGQHLRQLVAFTRHDVMIDPPFRQIDLVSCRNLIMYFDDEAQEKAIARIHFGLQPGGMLFLGSAEQVNHYKEEFDVLDRSARIYRKRRDTKLIDLELAPINPKATLHATPKTPVSPSAGRTFYDSTTNLEMLIEAVVQVGLIVDSDGQLVHSIGDSKRYLTIRPGPMRSNIYDMLSDELRTPVLTTVLRSERTSRLVETRNIDIDASGEQQINITAQPIQKLADGTTQILVRFLPPTPGPDARSNLIDSEQDEDEQQFLLDLQEELELTRVSLKEMIEEVGARNEELQAVNEEIMASNEELQTTNEELQSVNEELHTVNSEYQRKISELETVTDDMSNLLASTEIGTIFADSNLAVRQFTDNIKNFFPLRHSDVGRPLGELASRLGFLEIDDQIKQALSAGATSNLDIQDQAGRWFQLRILPYRRYNHKISGVVLAFIDIDDVKQAEIRAEKERERFRAIVEDQDEFVTRFDPSLRLTFVNRAFAEYLDQPPAKLLGQSFIEFIPDDQKQAVQDQILSVPGNRALTHEHEVLLGPGERRWHRWTARAIADESGKIAEYQSIGRDISQQKLSLEDAERSLFQLKSFLDVTTALMAMTDQDGTIFHTTAAWRRLLDYEEKDFLGSSIFKFLSNDGVQILKSIYGELTVPADCEGRICEFMPRSRKILTMNVAASAVQVLHVPGLSVILTVTYPNQIDE